MTTPDFKPGVRPDSSECVEQAYFFRTFRDRVAENLPAQDVLARVHQEVLPSTRLPYAIEFLATELRHSGRLSLGFHARRAPAPGGRDPLFLFAALQRQLGYPEVPRPRKTDDVTVTLDKMSGRIRELETRLRMLESETRGTFDPTQFGRPDLFRDPKDEE